MTFKFEPRGLLALAPQAYGQVYESIAVDVPKPPTPVVAIVSIRGPLMHHPQPWGRDGTPPPDCYDDIRCRVMYALQSDAQCVVLSIDSPGGLVNGCFETARVIKSMADAAGKPLYAYIDGQCCSAAYALACACTLIFAPETSIVGSIGVLDCLVDMTKADAQMGLKYQLISSGARKTDGNPHNAMTDDAVAAAQGRVDDLATFFFGFVAENRNGLSVDDVRALQAETFTGSRALALQLVDGVLTLDSLVTSLTANPAGIQMAKYDDSMAALMAEADGDDPKKAARAKKALAAMFAEDKTDKDKDEDKDEEAASASGEEPPAKDEDDDKKKKEEEARASAAQSSATAAAPAASPVAQVATDRTKLLEARANERKALLAARPDLSPDQLAVFRDPKRMSLESLRATLPTILVATGPALVAPTAERGTKPVTATATGAAGEMTAERIAYREEANRAMGIQANSKPHWEGDKWVTPFVSRDQRRREAAAEAAKKGNVQ